MSSGMVAIWPYSPATADKVRNFRLLFQASAALLIGIMIEQAIKMFPTKKAFCRAVGMSPQFLYQIEKGERLVCLRYAVKIASLPGCDLSVHDIRPDIFGPAPATPAEAA